jgi:hypothetical protein
VSVERAVGFIRQDMIGADGLDQPGEQGMGGDVLGGHGDLERD